MDKPLTFYVSSADLNSLLIKNCVFLTTIKDVWVVSLEVEVGRDRYSEGTVEKVLNMIVDSEEVKIVSVDRFQRY